MSSSIEITLGSIADVLLIDAQVPEFELNISKQQDIEYRLSGAKYLILIARVDGEYAGYKLGYELSPQTFYSWLGAVVPQFRRRGVAKALLCYQESWVAESGYSAIEVKSMNRFPAMLQLLIANEYRIRGYQDVMEKGAGKILFYKELL